MKINSFKRLYVQVLKDLYSAESQLVKAIPRMVEAASSHQLQEALKEHFVETKEQVSRLEQIFDSLDFSPRGHTCVGMRALIQEAKDLINEEDIHPDVKDAGLIASSQKVEHYEIAAYGTAIQYAKLLGDMTAAELLTKTLNEEKTTDKRLTRLARDIVNEQALQADKS